jgi:hypothetical protein
VEKLKLHSQLMRLRALLQKDKVVEAYSCLLKMLDELEEDLLYRNAKKDWHDMNEEFQRERKR